MADGRTRLSAQTQSSSPKRRRFGRPLLRALHRDAGYLVVGLTCVYALSGIAVNHIKDWDPSFDNYERSHQLRLIATDNDARLAKQVLTQLHIAETPRDVYRSEPDLLDITFDKRSLHVTPSTGGVLEQGQNPRFFLRAANYLHLNRGKRAWGYVADGYAFILLCLALSGLFMLPGRRGFLGRGLILALLGASVPILYVTLSR
jgi:hypothetical protein